jgi:hypothetical protein
LGVCFKEWTCRFDQCFIPPFTSYQRYNIIDPRCIVRIDGNTIIPPDPLPLGPARRGSGVNIGYGESVDESEKMRWHPIERAMLLIRRNGRLWVMEITHTLQGQTDNTNPTRGVRYNLIPLKEEGSLNREATQNDLQHFFTNDLLSGTRYGGESVDHFRVVVGYSPIHPEINVPAFMRNWAHNPDNNPLLLDTGWSELSGHYAEIFHRRGISNDEESNETTW